MLLSEITAKVEMKAVDDGIFYFHATPHAWRIRRTKTSKHCHCVYLFNTHTTY